MKIFSTIKEHYTDAVIFFMGLVCLGAFIQNYCVMGDAVFSTEETKPIEIAKSEDNFTGSLLLLLCGIGGTLQGSLRIRSGLKQRKRSE